MIIHIDNAELTATDYTELKQWHDALQLDYLSYRSALFRQQNAHAKQQTRLLTLAALCFGIGLGQHILSSVGYWSPHAPAVPWIALFAILLVQYASGRRYKKEQLDTWAYHSAQMKKKNPLGKLLSQCSPDRILSIMDQLRLECALDRPIDTTNTLHIQSEKEFLR